MTTRNFALFVATTFSLLLAQQPETSPGPTTQATRFTQHRIGTRGEPLTPPSAKPAREVAREYTLQAVPGLDMDSVYTAKEYTDAHNGVTHILYRQQFQGLEVYNAAWSVNLDRDGRVLNAGGALYGRPQFGAPSLQRSATAARAAVQSVNAALASRFAPFPAEKQPAADAAATSVRFAAGPLADELDGRMIWYAVRGQLVPAWLFQVIDADASNIKNVVVDDITGMVLDSRAASFRFQAPTTPAATRRGLVFERESPHPNPKPGTLVNEAPPLAERTLQPFTGDPIASPRGWVSGNQTIGNNAVAGQNARGVFFLSNPITATADGNGDFSFPLPLGPGNPPTTAFADAITTNLFYWVNRSHDLFYASGFTEAAGNFQQDNLGRGGNGGDPIYAYTHFAAQANNTAATINAFFTEKGLADGSQPMIAMFIGHSGRGGFYTDGALDNVVVVHEYAHGVSLRLLPLGYDTFHVASMGEAWSDYFGLDFTLPEGAPAGGTYSMGEYFDWTWGYGDFRSRPYSTDMATNSLTFRDMGKVIQYPQVHSDGEIWMMALWEMRANLIQQLGEREGRRRARILILDGMKFMPIGSTMVDARDAILLADRAGFNGASQNQIWAAFARRGFGATAYAASGDSVHIHPSFDLPSEKGRIDIYDSQITIGEPLRIVVSDANVTAQAVSVQAVSSSGDLETIALRRSGSIFAGLLPTSGNIVLVENATLNLTPGDVASVFYDDGNAGGGAFAQVSATVPVMPPYFVTGTPAGFDTSGSETVVQDAQRVELPFDFPFYGKTYRSLVVSVNGFLALDDTQVNACADVFSLRAIPAIAPFWSNLTVQGFAQPREGIFYRQIAPDAVRFRWAAETVTGFGTGTPVNFQAVLQSDGAIIFSYGAGNTDLHAVLTPIGCTAATNAPIPTVGISPGHDTYQQGTFIKTSWTNTTGLRFDPPFNQFSDPRVIVESPAADAVVRDVLTVSGIAYDDQTNFSRAYVLIDGKQFGSVGQNAVRLDFCATQAVRGCPVVGFTINVNTADLKPGAHSLVVRGINARGSITDSSPVAFTIESGQGRLPFGKIESPLPDTEVLGTLIVRGYAAISDLRVAGVDTIIDGVTFGPTTYGITRNDVCPTLDPRPLNCPAIGFQLAINTRTGLPPLQDGPHTLQIRVRDEAGRAFLLPDSVTFTVANGVYEPPRGAITSIKNGDVLKGRVEISGYAYSPGSAIRAVLVVWDNQITEPATVNQPAAEACAGLPDVTECPNIGWTANFDTRRLSNGPHTMYVLLLNARGDITYLPSVGQRAIAVTVEN